MRFTALIALGLLAACARPAPRSEAARPPSTHADPPPYVPPAQTSGRPGAPVGLAVASGFAEARHVALDLLRAVIEGDPTNMGRLLDERLARTMPRIGPVERGREHVIAYALVEARRRGLGPTVTLDELLGGERLAVAPLSAYLDRGDGPPAGLRSTDLVVSVPLSDRGRRALRRVLPGWLDHGRIIVRLGAEPRVVGL